MLTFWIHPCYNIVIKYILQVSNQVEHRLVQEDSDADDVSEQNECSDEVIPSTWQKHLCHSARFSLLSPFFFSYFHLPDSFSQKAEVICAWRAFWGRGQSSEEQCSHRKDTINTWKSPARNRVVQKPACSTDIRGRFGLVVGETGHAATPV